MTLLLKINGKEYKEYWFNFRKEYNSKHTIEEIKKNKMPWFYEYQLEEPISIIEPGDIAYLIDNETQHPIQKCAVVKNNKNTLTLILLIAIPSSKATIDLERQVQIAPESLVEHFQKHTDILYHNGFHIYSHPWLEKNNITLNP